MYSNNLVLHFMGHFIILGDKEQSRMTVGSIITVNMEITHNPLMVSISHPLIYHMRLQEYEDNDIVEEEDIVANKVVDIVTMIM